MQRHAAGRFARASRPEGGVVKPEGVLVVTSLSHTDYAEVTSDGPVWDSGRVPLRKPASRPTVLVVEDDDAFREFVAGILTADGYDVVQARDGGDLLERVAEAAVRTRFSPRPFSVVVTDLRMPGLSGLDAVELLRAGPWQRTPVIVMTAFGDHATHDMAHRLGARAVLDKPFEVEDLQRAVREAVSTVHAPHWAPGDLSGFSRTGGRGARVPAWREEWK